MKRSILCDLILLVFVVKVSALSFMGPPKAELNQGQYGLGLDYTFSEMDVELSGYGVSWTEEIETNTLFTNLSYGNTNDWEVFLRLGLSKVEADDFDGDNEFAYGFGTKVNLGMDWGILFQVGWFEGNDTVTGFLPGFGIVTADQEIDAYEIQIAIGPTYDAGNYKIYGGPFFHFIDGDLDVDIAGIGSGSFDIEEESMFGGYVGFLAEITSNSDIGVEFQFTGDTQAVGLRYIHRF